MEIALQLLSAFTQVMTSRRISMTAFVNSYKGFHFDGFPYPQKRHRVNLTNFNGLASPHKELRVVGFLYPYKEWSQCDTFHWLRKSI